MSWRPLRCDRVRSRPSGGLGVRKPARWRSVPWDSFACAKWAQKPALLHKQIGRSVIGGDLKKRCQQRARSLSRTGVLVSTFGDPRPVRAADPDAGLAVLGQSVGLAQRFVNPEGFGLDFRVDDEGRDSAARSVRPGPEIGVSPDFIPRENYPDRLRSWTSARCQGRNGVALRDVGEQAQRAIERWARRPLARDGGREDHPRRRRPERPERPPPAAAAWLASGNGVPS